MTKKQKSKFPLVKKNNQPKLPLPKGSADQILAHYMREVGKTPLLTRQEEKDLAIKVYKDQDRLAAQHLAKANLRFVIKIAMEYARYANRVVDLIQEGNLGLMHAIRRFNPYKEVKLTSYAVWWIRSYIQDYLLRNWSLVRMGTTKTQKKLFYRLKKVQKRLEDEGISPHPKLIAMDLNVPEKDVKIMQERMAAKDFSLNSPMQKGEGAGSESFLNMLPDEEEATDEKLASAEIKEIFSRALQEFRLTLNDREQHLLDARLLAEKPATLLDLGKKMGVSKERTRQIEEKIKKALREFLSEKYPSLSID